MRYFAVALVIAMASAAVAQTPPKSQLVRGTIQSFDATSIAIKLDAGAVITAAITPKTSFSVVEPRTFEQLKTTDFVGITAVPGRNGHLRAEEIHILPVVGLGEGQYPWDHHPSMSHAMMSSSMTNGSVAMTHAATHDSMTNGKIAGAGGHALTITYKGSEMVDGKCVGHADPSKPGCTGTATVDVGALTPIVAVVKGAPSDGKVGLFVVARVVTDDQGHRFLASVTFEKNGVKPEF